MKDYPSVFDPQRWCVVVERLRLSKREAAVATLCLDSHSVSEMGAMLGLSPHTVRSHLERIYRKAGVTNRFDLLIVTVQLAYQSAAHQKNDQSRLQA